METLLISFGAGIAASDCASACGDRSETGRWMLALSIIIFIPPIWASPLFRRLRILAIRRRMRRTTLPQLMG